jgi:hypothetical protein
MDAVVVGGADVGVTAGAVDPGELLGVRILTLAREIGVTVDAQHLAVFRGGERGDVHRHRGAARARQRRIAMTRRAVVVGRGRGCVLLACGRVRVHQQAEDGSGQGSTRHFFSVLR